ncbi:MAG: DUF5808 domain-containing protein [Chitinophagales bacterium]
MENENEFYKFGFLYFNKEDKRILVPKRFHLLGWTLNFANPYSYIILAVILLIIGIGWYNAPQ